MRKVMITDIEEKASHLEDVLMNMIDDVRQTSSQSKALENQVMMLSKERDVLNLSLGKERKKSQEQEEEILKLQNIIDSLHDQRKHLLANFDKELNSQNQLMKSKYEIEVLSTKVRSLEREISGQRVEMEQLRMINQQLRRDLSRSHHA